MVESDGGAFDEPGVPGIEFAEIARFVQIARAEAAGEVVACDVERSGGHLRLRVRTKSGRVLDEVSLPAGSLALGLDETLRRLQRIVPVTRNPRPRDARKPQRGQAARAEAAPPRPPQGRPSLVAITGGKA